MRFPFAARLSALGLVLAALALTSCGPVEAWQDDLEPYPQVHLTSYYLTNKIRVDKPVANRVGAGQLQVAATVRNLTGSELRLDYQYRFVNKPHGTQVEETSGWHFVRLPPYGWEQITATSMTALPGDFDLDIREAK